MKSTFDSLLQKFSAKFRGKKPKLPNCFNAVQYYWNDSESLRHMEPGEFAAYIKNNFAQIDLNSIPLTGDVEIVWSRTSEEIPTGSIRIDGPYDGLVVEHAFVNIDGTSIFQKADPRLESPYEVISRDEALSSYVDKGGFEVTRHRII